MSEQAARQLEEKLGRCASNDPIVRACVMSVWRETLSVEDALTLAVRILSEERTRLQETQAKLALAKPLEPLVVKGVDGRTLAFTPPGWTMVGQVAGPFGETDCAKAVAPSVERRTMPRPEDMNGFSDQFPGTDEGSHYDSVSSK